MAESRPPSPTGPSRIIDRGWHPLAEGGAPSWANAWGQDLLGVWAAYTLADVTQRLRWIPPGLFTMGSPLKGPGRSDNEGPAHEVLISEGYWLFDTPVTQALWVAVMGHNPSMFQSLERPVDSVSWHDARTFLAKINARAPGSALTLLTEAQWERACRARTRSAIFTGDLDIRGDANAPA